MALGTLGAILGAAGTAASGIMSAINNKKRIRSQEAESARRIASYESLANEDALSKASNQRLLNQYDRSSQDQLRKAQDVAAITGATPEYALGVQKGIAEGRADLMSSISANQELSAERALENAEKAYQDAALEKQKMYAERDMTYANLAANAANAASSIISGVTPRKENNQNDTNVNSQDDKKESGKAVVGQ